MLPKEETLLFNAQYYNKEKFSDTATKKRISKHLSDINDKITEEDIKNVKTDIDSLISLKVEKNNNF